jgi:hypothetical protein
MAVTNTATTGGFTTATLPTYSGFARTAETDERRANEAYMRAAEEAEARYRERGRNPAAMSWAQRFLGRTPAEEIPTPDRPPYTDSELGIARTAREAIQDAAARAARRDRGRGLGPEIVIRPNRGDMSITVGDGTGTPITMPISAEFISALAELGIELRYVRGPGAMHDTVYRNAGTPGDRPRVFPDEAARPVPPEVAQAYRGLRDSVFAMRPAPVPPETPEEDSAPAARRHL